MHRRRRKGSCPREGCFKRTEHAVHLNVWLQRCASARADPAVEYRRHPQSSLVLWLWDRRAESLPVCRARSGVGGPWSTSQVTLWSLAWLAALAQIDAVRGSPGAR